MNINSVIAVAIILWIMYQLIIYLKKVNQEKKLIRNTEKLLKFIANNDYSKVESILSNNRADVNYKDKATGDCPLILAVKNNNAKLVELLIHKGADILAINKQNENAYDLAVKLAKTNCDYQQVINIFESTKIVQEQITKEKAHQQELAREKQEAAQERKDRELVVACKKGDIDRVKKALAKGANVNAKLTDNYGLKMDTPLMTAAENGFIDIVEMLINEGAKVRIRGFASTALMNAARNGHHNIVDLLLVKGANANDLNELLFEQYPIITAKLQELAICKEYEQKDKLNIINILKKLAENKCGDSYDSYRSKNDELVIHLETKSSREPDGMWLISRWLRVFKLTDDCFSCHEFNESRLD